MTIYHVFYCSGILYQLYLFESPYTLTRFQYLTPSH